MGKGQGKGVAKPPKKKLKLTCDEGLPEFRKNYRNYGMTEGNVFKGYLTHRYEFSDEKALEICNTVSTKLRKVGYQLSMRLADDIALTIMMNVIKAVWYEEASGGKWNPPLTLNYCAAPLQEDEVPNYTHPEFQNLNP